MLLSGVRSAVATAHTSATGLDASVCAKGMVREKLMEGVLVKQLRILAAIMLVVGVVFVPAAAQAARQCSTIEGDAFLDFGAANAGVAELFVDGEFQVVDFFGTGFRPTGENTADIRFVFFFEQGPLVIVEHSVTTPIGEGLVSFDSDLDIKKGGSGSLEWYGVTDQAAGFADIQHITGEICFGR